MAKRYIPISDLGEIVTGKTPPTANGELWGGSIHFITPTDIKGFSSFYQGETERTVSDIGASKQKKTLLPKNSVCVSCIATIGKMCLTSTESITNQQINTIVPNKNYDYRYVLYLLRYNLPYIQLVGGGSGSGTPIISKSKFAKFTFLIEDSLPTQQKIASILSAYDSQIENNQKRIKLLEQMAENLYKEWFVRFRFPGYENAEFEGGVPKGWVSLVGDNKKPKGWTYGELNQLGTFIRGKNITAAEMIEGQVPVISAGLEPAGYHNQANVCGPCLTISSSGANAGYLKYNLTDIWAADCSYYNNPDNIWFVYSSLKYLQPVISNLQCGAAQPHVYPKDVNRLCVILPPKSLITEYNRQSSLFFKNIHNLKNQIFLLTHQRDLLLPRLMSGKLSI